MSIACYVVKELWWVFIFALTRFLSFYPVILQAASGSRENSNAQTGGQFPGSFQDIKLFRVHALTGIMMLCFVSAKCL